VNVQGETPVIRQLLDLAQAALPQVVQEVIEICQIPAPTFEEQQRTQHVRERMTALGLADVKADEVGNVVGRLGGTGRGPAVMLAAHIDTVFPMGTDVTVKRDGDILRAPGVGDNSASVAAMLHTARVLKEGSLRLDGDVYFAATVGEEGLGNLRGIRRVMEEYGALVDYVIALDGSLGSMVRQGVGSRRFRLTVTAEGGHSWGAFGSPSAIHSLGRIIAQVADIRVPTSPKTTFNVGLISGGTSVNTIAAQAEAVIDLRSLDVDELRRLEEKVRRIAADICRQSGVTHAFELLGDRPTGAILDDHPLCQAVRRVHHQMGMQTRVYPSSTDGNVPLSLGIPSVTVGVTLGGNGHRTDEYIHASPLGRGVGQLLLLLLEVQKLPVRPR
jgi:acetylornithine deacetylase/succinyl-diaminopimelate desuccinylase-like protein